jgi:hypothetical protein
MEHAMKALCRTNAIRLVPWLCIGAVPLTAHAEADACRLLTAAQVSAAIGTSVSAGTHVTPTFLETCTWTPSAGSNIRAVTVNLQGATVYELLHTFGATDKYDLTTGLPQYPEGFAEPESTPRYPQQHAEIMAGRMPLTATEAVLPDGLEDERVGPLTAREIGWLSH